LRQFLLVLLALFVGGSVGLSVTAASAGSGAADATPTSASAGAPSSGSDEPRRTAASERARMHALRYLTGEVQRYQRRTWHWQRLMGRPLTDTNGRVMTKLSVQDAKRAVVLWRRHARAARRLAQHPPHLRAWLCIHRYEAAWHDHGPIYYGGLQMDLTFQRRYAPRLLRAKGTADHWTPLEQIWVAETARRSGRGFYPWPNTARACGLI
jgi:hypothetical protein